MDHKPKFYVRSEGRRHMVVENSTGLIWRTLDTRSDAGAWIAQAEAKKGR